MKTTLEDEDYHEEKVEASGQSDVHKYFLNLEKMKKEKRRALEKDLEEQESSGDSGELLDQNSSEVSDSKIEEGIKKQESAKQGHNNNEMFKNKEDTQKKTNKIVYSDEIVEEEIINEPRLKWEKQSKSQGTQTDVECDSNEDCYNKKKKKERADDSTGGQVQSTSDPSVNERQEKTNGIKTHEEYIPIDHKSNLSLSDKQSSLKSFDSLLLDELWKLRKV